jgi:hypothetical protein
MMMRPAIGSRIDRNHVLGHRAIGTTTTSRPGHGRSGSPSFHQPIVQIPLYTTYTIMAPRQRLAEAPPSAEEELLTAAAVALVGDSKPLLVPGPSLEEERAKDQHDRFNIVALVRWKTIRPTRCMSLYLSFVRSWTALCHCRHRQQLESTDGQLYWTLLLSELGGTCRMRMKRNET